MAAIAADPGRTRQWLAPGAGRARVIDVGRLCTAYKSQEQEADQGAHRPLMLGDLGNAVNRAQMFSGARAPKGAKL